MKMSKIFSITFAAIMAMTLAACDNNDPYDRHYDWDSAHPWNGGKEDNYAQELSQTERGLVGSYVSDDGEQEIYLVLNDDRTGYCRSGENLQTFKWYVTGSNLIVKDSSTKEEKQHTFNYRNNQLYVDNIPFVANKGQSSVLNDYEKKLVGSYVSDDNPKSVFYLVLNNDRTGSTKTVKDGKTSSGTFTWRATSNMLYVKYTGESKESDGMQYSFTSDHLYVDGIPLVANNGQQSTDPIVSQWQGAYAASYYASVWNITNLNCATVMEFTASGEGVQLDYDTSNPRVNYAYSPFTWTKSDNLIKITYVGNENLTTATTNNYALTSSQFTGQMSFAGLGTYGFLLASTTGFDWSPYITQTRTRSATTFLHMLRMSGSQAKRSGIFAQR